MPGDAPAGARFNFSRRKRLRRAWEFERTRDEGQRLVKGCMILNWRFNQDQRTSRLGVVTSKKIGNAVARSRARRLLREAFRLHQHDFTKPVDLVLVARQSIAGKGLRQVEGDFITAARQARLF